MNHNRSQHWNIVHRLYVGAFAIFISFASWASPLYAQAPKEWDPKRTWVFVIGVLEWIDPNIRGFPKDHRQDAELVETLKTRGVPESRIVCLYDTEATVARASEAFDQILSKTEPDDWLILENLVYGFKGDPTMDDDANGFVTLGEVASNILEDMTFADDQMPQYVMTRPLTSDVVISKVAGLAQGGVGRRVEVLSNGEWFRALVKDREGDRFLVHYYGYPSIKDDWVERSEIRLLTKLTFGAGLIVDVESSGTWYPSKILAVKNGLHLVRYAGWGKEWNEWVPASRIRILQSTK